MTKKLKNRPTGLKYNQTKYQVLYLKLQNFIATKKELPTKEEFYAQAEQFCKQMKVESIMNALVAVRKSVLLHENDNTGYKNKLFKLITASEGKDLIDLVD